jgi:membrane-associated phospholipid phosphatase
MNVNRLRLHLHPSDRAVTALLALAVLVAAVRLPAAGGDLPGLLVLQLALLCGFLACVAAMIRWERSAWVQFVRPAVTVAIIFTCYTSLGKLGVAAMPPCADEELARMDTWLFGVDPSDFMQRYQTPATVEFFSFIYAAFIPYIYLSIALNCLGRPPLDRDQFLTGWVFTYAISFLGYLFLPAHGPVLYPEAHHHGPLEGGFFLHVVRQGVDASGGVQGAFPSLHVGGSVYLCLFDLQSNRLRGLTYLPMVLGIYVATILLRYHYVVDLIAGTVIAAGCIPLGQKVFLRWARRREAAGLPALPGGEADALPAVSGAGAPDTPSVLSAD